MKFTPLAVAALVVLLTGCSPSKGDGRDCIEVPEDAKSMIAEGANKLAISPGAAGAVKSKTFKDVTIVAMDFTAPDGASATGVWAVSGNLHDGRAVNVVMSVDAMAAEFTDWPNKVNGRELDVTEDGVTEAKACLSRA